MYGIYLAYTNIKAPTILQKQYYHNCNAPRNPSPHPTHHTPLTTSNTPNQYLHRTQPHIPHRMPKICPRIDFLPRGCTNTHDDMKIEKKAKILISTIGWSATRYMMRFRRSPNDPVRGPHRGNEKGTYCRIDETDETTAVSHRIGVLRPHWETALGDPVDAGHDPDRYQYVR